jgi:hypothetical protein
MRVIAALLVVVAIATVTATYRFRHDLARWEPDAAIYLRMALADRGASPAEAKAVADRFMLTTSDATAPTSRGFYGPATPAYYADQFALFRTRPLFPRLGALLYPWFGPHGLQLISAVAYVLACVVLFFILLPLAPPWLAALGALALGTAPVVLEMSAYAMTDELALLFWTAALGAILAYQRRPGIGWLAAATLAAALLTFTRPAAYLPIGAAAGLWFAAGDRGARATTLRMLGAVVAVALAFMLYTLVVHGPTLREQLTWIYHWQLATGAIGASTSFAAWYLTACARSLALALTEDIYKNGALLTIVLAAFGALVTRQRAIVPVLLASIAALAVAIAGGPLDITRTVLLPLTPPLIVLAVAALAELARSPALAVRRGSAAV